MNDEMVTASNGNNLNVFCDYYALDQLCYQSLQSRYRYTMLFLLHIKNSYDDYLSVFFILIISNPF